MGRISRVGVTAALMAAASWTGAAAATAPATSHKPGPAHRVGSVFRDCSSCPDMVVIPSGAFVMGSPPTEKGRDPDEAQHKVTIRYAFAVSRYPITWDQWEACARDNVCAGRDVEIALRTGPDGMPIKNYVDHGRGDRPVVGVSWYDAQVYVGWLNRKTDKDAYRLLSDAEFEYAARAGTRTVFWWGDQPSHDYANYGKDDDQGLGGAVSGRDIWDATTSPVGSFPPNPWGLYDMYGNIYQWIEDCYEKDAMKLPIDGSAVKDANCNTRGFRSNSFESNPHTMRAANRAFPYRPQTRGRDYLGIRVAKSLN